MSVLNCSLKLYSCTPMGDCGVWAIAVVIRVKLISKVKMFFIECSFTLKNARFTARVFNHELSIFQE